MNKILIFGDSFSNTFKSFKDPNIKLFKYKGATAKGLTNINNENRKDILKNINKDPNFRGCLIFVFGNVDLHLSYYYTLLLKKNFDIKEIIKSYVEFIASIKVNKNVSKYIFNIYPSPILYKNILAHLFLYKIIGKDITLENKELILEHSNDELRLKRLKEINNFLKEQCIKNKLNFVDINKDIMEKNKIKSIFIDPSIYNIHLRYEPQLKYIKNKITKCKIKNNCLVNASKKYKSKKILSIKNRQYQNKIIF